MTALVQGAAGIALVMSFALLGIRQTGVARILIAAELIAVATAAVAAGGPAGGAVFGSRMGLALLPGLMMGLAPLLLAGLCWVAPAHIPRLDPMTIPAGGSRLGIAAGGLLAVLCQSQGVAGLPLAIVLLSVLLAATRSHHFMHLIALVALQNGIVLAASLQPVAAPDLILAACCVLLPLPLAAVMLGGNVAIPKLQANRWWGWIDLTAAVAVLVAAVVLPLDPIGAIFAPLLGLDGVFRSWRRAGRIGLSPWTRGFALLTSTLAVAATASANPAVGWIMVAAAVVPALHPAVHRASPRHWARLLLALIGAGLVFAGLTFLATTPTVGYFSLFAATTMVAAVLPELAPVLVIILLRVAIQDPWPAAAIDLGIVLSLGSLIACGAAVVMRRRGDVMPLLVLSQTSIAALALFAGGSDGRFAALLLLALIIMTRTATRLADEPARAVATAGLGGVSPIGVFPGLIMVALAVSGHYAWLLLPAGGALLPVLRISLPRRMPWFTRSLPSAAWLPLALSAFAGYFAPESLVHWCHMLTAGPR